MWIVSLSLKPPATLTDGKFYPAGFTLDNYTSIFNDDDIHSLRWCNSIGIAADRDADRRSSLAAMAAYAIARLDFPGKAVILSGALAIAMFPPISIVGPLFNMWRTLGLYDTWPGLIIPYMTFTLPLAIYTLSAFFREIPWELEQAAQVDGATPFQAFRKVIAAARRAGRVHGGDPRLHLRLERLRLRHHADVDRQRAHRARGARVLHRRLAVHSSRPARSPPRRSS